MIHQIDDDLSSDSEIDSIDFYEEASKIEEYKIALNEDSNQYDSHVNLINGLHYLMKYDEARVARESMNKIFPLSPDLWLQWIKDEREAGTSSDMIISLYWRAVKEYSRVIVWISFLQYLIDIDHLQTDIRKIYEQSVEAVGTSFKSIDLWQIILLFEIDVVLASMIETKAMETSEVQSQISIIDSLYIRVLSLPILDKEKLFEEYKMFCKNYNCEFKENIMDGSMKQIEELSIFEKELSDSTDENKLDDAWLNYLKHAEKHYNKDFIINLYERAVSDMSLSGNIWLNYLRYLEKHLEQSSKLLDTYKRALRNNNTTLNIWLGYTRYCEKIEVGVNEIREIYNSIFKYQIVEVNAFVTIWLAYFDFEKRLLDKMLLDNVSKDYVPDMSTIRILFDRLLKMSNYLDYDPQCTLIKYWAFIEAKYAKNLDKSRELWEIIRKSLGNYSSVVLENMEFERKFGDFSSFKTLAKKSLNLNNLDHSEYLYDRILRITAEDGDLDSYLQFLKKVDIQRQKTAKLSAEAQIIKPVKSNKRSAAPIKSPNKSKIRKISENANQMEICDKTEPAANNKDSKIQHNDEHTLFVSNLDFKVNEEQLKNKFSEVTSRIVDVRIVNDANGKSRGFAYVQFENDEARDKGLTLERSMLSNRPMFVSKSDPNSRHKFQYAVDQVERNKLFVSNLPKTITKQALETIFSKYGKLVSVRIPSFKNGAQKNFAYVEFDDENTASKAIVNTDGLNIGGNVIKVVISRTPAKSDKPKLDKHQPGTSTDNQSTKKSEFIQPTARPMLAPRKLIHQRSGAAVDNNDIKEKKTNDDFRKFLH